MMASTTGPRLRNTVRSRVDLWGLAREAPVSAQHPRSVHQVPPTFRAGKSLDLCAFWSDFEVFERKTCDLHRELVFLILQFLDEEKFKETVHKLEQESGFYFNMKHFEDLVQAGEWDEVERYLGGFTKVEDNRYSMKIFFEIRKQKYLEALDRHDRAKAVEILVKDLKVFASFNEELFKEITQLLTLENFRQNEQLSNFSAENINKSKS
ncbi:hypothetical protein OPV22_018120 [Ensete ventricosum]|uniref:CTLH domain-containing protein n=1 Tax=Ensete ventricosum TaxID=4639 RepID=A0AAV8PFZ0_ENSVE|nr:hypothetical protein OPV22_018120 [Ensete ventricosum]